MLLLVLNAVAAFYYDILHRSSPFDQRWTRDAFLNTPWINEYVRENYEAGALDWHSYVYWRRKPFKGRYINVDSRGIRATWRDPRHSDEKPLQIFMLGGSTVWGTGSRDDFTLPSLVAKQVANQKTGRPVEITNLGELGYVNTQDLLTLLVELHRGHVPDAVIFYDGVNDLGATFQGGQAGIPQNELNRRVEFERPGAAFAYALMKESSLFRPILWRVAFRTWQAENSRLSPEDQSKLADNAIRLYAANLAIIEGLGRQFGFKSLFFWQPVVFTKRHLTPGEQASSEEQGFMRDFFQQGYADMRQNEALLANSDFHDISEILDAVEEPVYFDIAHITEHGNELVAIAMLPYVQQMLASLNETRP
jgi:hypothetical protein